MLTALLVTLGVVSYLNIGYWWGRLSWKAWSKRKRSFAGLLSFPVSYSDDSIGKFIDKVPINSFTNADTYTNVMTFAWPAKLTFNLFIAIISTCTIVCLGAYIIGKNIVLPLVKLTIKIATNPLTLFPQRPPKKPPKQLPPAQPDPNQCNLDERQHLLEQREKIDARLKKIEAHPDYKKIRDLPRRF